jgi:hypothetical protein
MMTSIESVMCTSLSTLLLLTACGAAESGWSGDVEDSDREISRIEQEGQSEGRRGELHSVLRDDPTNADALAELREMDREEDAAAGLVLQVDVAPGHVVKFFAPAPGERFVIEVGSFDESGHANSVILDEQGAMLSYDQIWSRIGDGTPLPTLLWQPESVVSDVPPPVPEEPFEATESFAPFLGNPPGSALSLMHVSTGTHFLNDQRGCGAPTPTVNPWCWVDRSGPFWAQSTNSTAVVFTVAMWAGNAMTVRAKLNQTHDFTIVPNQFVVYSWQVNGSCWPVPLICWMNDTTIRAEILDAEVYVDKWHSGGGIAKADWPGALFPSPAPANN